MAASLHVGYSNKCKKMSRRLMKSILKKLKTLYKKWNLSCLICTRKKASRNWWKTNKNRKGYRKCSKSISFWHILKKIYTRRSKIESYRGHSKRLRIAHCMIILISIQRKLKNLIASKVGWKMLRRANNLTKRLRWWINLK